MLAATLRSLAGLRLTDDDGDEHVLELLPPASDAELRAIETATPCPLPDDIRDALRVSKGLARGLLESFSLVDSTVWGPVFYACHDPPVIAFQAPTVEQFLLDAVAIWRSGSRSPVDVVHEDVVHRIWRESSEPREPDASAPGDPALKAFVDALPPDAVVVDLRQPVLGDGFAWGRFGPRTTIQRAGEDRVWAVIPPERKPGFLQRIFHKP